MSRTEPSSGSGSQSLFGDITSLFSLVLFLVFVTCALFTVTIGSRVYAGIQEKNDRIFYEDTSVSYIKNKIRQPNRFIDYCHQLFNLPFKHLIRL